LREFSGIDLAARESLIEDVVARIAEAGLRWIRVSCADPHAHLRTKTVDARLARQVMRAGISMVSTLWLKDTADRTAFRVFEPGGVSQLPGFGQGNNLCVLPDPRSFRILPWCNRTGWMRAEPFFSDGTAVDLDPRRVLQRSLARLKSHGLRLRCGLEVEFHVFQVQGTAHLDPDSGEWPGLAPQVSLLHPGHRLLSEAWTDRCESVLHRVYAVAEAIGAPIRSVEVEMGPSQFEAVFDPSDALQAADDLVLFRNAIVMALHRESLHASFTCLTPFAQSMASGWHVHQSLVDAQTGVNRMMRNAPAHETDASDAAHLLSDLGEHYLGGLLAHAQGITLYCVPMANAYARFRPNTLAPQSVVWGCDNRGAMLRVIGGAGEPDTRIENRLPEAAANPYLCLAAQIEAGLDGIARNLRAGKATEDPYAASPGSRAPPPALLPASLEEAIAAALADQTIANGLGQDFVAYFCAIKSAEARRRAECPDPADFDRREYFGRL